MADISNLLTNKIAKGFPVRVYSSPTVNTDGTITLSTAGGLDATAHPSAKEIGFTQDGVELTRTPTIEDLPVDQRLENILQAVTAQDVHMKFKMLQIRDYANVVALNPGLAALTGTGFSGMTDTLNQTLTLVPVCAVAPTPNDVTKFQVMILYACCNVAPFSATLSKKYNVTALDLKGFDAGRSSGASWAFYETTV